MPTKANLPAALREGALVLDGATGTELQRRGCPTDLPLWSARALLDSPETVRAIHEDYWRAGAQIVVANTFRTNVRTLAGAGLLSRGREMNATAVRLAREARERAGGCGWVAASVAPVEDCYCPERVPPDDELREEHRRMAEWLVQAQPDLIWVETMNTVREAHVAAQAAAETGLPFVVSLAPREDGRLLGGEPLSDAVAAIEPLDPLAIGVNCAPPRGILAALRTLREISARPLAAYAHIGNAEPTAGWSFSESVAPDAYCDHARTWLAAGAAIIGGCCGTGPEHVAAMAGLVRDA